jgi:DNA-binding NarL/FixJ family response regulator
MSAITVALVNDYEVVIRGLANMLRNYTSEVSIVELDANKRVGKPVDVALYDTFAATQGDRDEIRRLIANPVVERVAVYTWNFTPHLADDSMSHGVCGYLSKGLPARDLVKAIQQIHAGQVVVSPKPAHSGAAATGGDWPGREEGLTEREAEVLALITQGFDNAAIADRMGLSPNSIKSYIRTCYRRIDVANRSNAILWGVKHGFTPDHLRITDTADINRTEDKK